MKTWIRSLSKEDMKIPNFARLRMRSFALTAAHAVIRALPSRWWKTFTFLSLGFNIFQQFTNEASFRFRLVLFRFY